ncbi:MAG: hypothetical protein JRI68_16255 [Deltaproteobacteria bacterium]|nr:hypothetical protein [Deltaproteobacteria bacterium]
MEGKGMRGTLLVLVAGYLGGVAFVVACDSGPEDVDAQDAGQGGDDCQCTVNGPIAIEEPVTVTGNVSIPEPLTVTGTVDLATQPLPVEVTGQPIDVNATIDPTMPIRVIAGADFKGVTTQSRTGTDGWATLNADCDAAFAGSRTCTDQEILNTFPGPTPGSDAWILWTTRAAYHDGTTAHVFNALGVASSSSSMNCADHNNPSPFSINSGAGFILTSGGNFGRGDCQNSYVVACCGL